MPLRSLFLVIALCLTCTAVRAQEEPPIDPQTGAVRATTFGDAAPRPNPETWVRGDPIDRFEPGKVYVVWFFSTWGPKSLKAAPTLADLHARFKDRGVTFVAVSLWETTKPLSGAGSYLDRVRTFVADNDALFPYSVAYDGDAGEMAQTWMRAADRKYIPAVFIVDKNGKIAWLGHPFSTTEKLDTVLEQVMAGNFDIKSAADKARAEAETIEQGRKLDRRFIKAMDAGDGPAAMKLLEEMMALRPGEFTDRATEVFKMVAIQNKDATGYTWVQTMAEGPLKDDAITLNNIAWAIATDPGLELRDLALALKLAQRAYEVSKGEEAFIIDTLARVHFDRGDIDRAIELQTEAVKKAKDGREADYQQTLDRYKAAKPN